MLIIFFLPFPRADGVNAYDHFLACCEKLGIPDVPERLQPMMILDYLICNQDRHFGNFGAIRDAVTLEWVGFAPIFDSGTSLWFDQYASKINALADTPAKPFAAHAAGAACPCKRWIANAESFRIEQLQRRGSCNL